jgi:hypothetical protein
MTHEERQLLQQLKRDNDEMTLAFDRARDTQIALGVFFVSLMNRLIRTGLVDRDSLIEVASDAAKEMKGTNAFEVQAQVEIIAQRLPTASPRPRRSLFGKLRSVVACWRREP